MFRTCEVRLPAEQVHVLGQVAPRTRDALDLGLAAEHALGADLGATRVTSAANAESWSTIVLIVSFSSSTSPLTSTVTFFERSPFAHCGGHRRDVPHLLGERRGQRLTLSVRSFHVRTRLRQSPGRRGAPPYHLAGDARHLRGERPELIDHRVDRVLQLEDRPSRRP
jgi:hypothetical protein